MEVMENEVADRKGATWTATVDKYKHPDLRRSCWQIVTSFVPFFSLLVAMYFSYFVSIWLLLLLAIPAAGFLVRIFIIQHDCGHRAFFRSRQANDVLGSLCGVLTLTPYQFWRRTHARHHVSSGNLDHRGYGDVMTLTVNEYRGRSKWGRFCYRVYRNPLFMFGFGASFMFLIQQRFTGGVPRSWARERMSVYGTNLAIVLILVAATYSIGLQVFLTITLPVVMLSAASGSWLFFVQHQYEDAYWEQGSDWDFTSSALEGSSYYELPSVLQWFTGNIGFHHIHHLNSRIPNYHLPTCYEAEAEFRKATTFGIRESFKCISFKLWDEDRQRMVGFGDIA